MQAMQANRMGTNEVSGADGIALKLHARALAARWQRMEMRAGTSAEIGGSTQYTNATRAPPAMCKPIEWTPMHMASH